MSTRWRHELAAVVVLLVATLALGRPWAFDPSRVFSQGDTAYTLANMLHLQDALTAGLPWSEGPLGWPLPDGVTRTDWTLFPALLTLPLRWLGVDALVMHSFVVVVGLFLTAWACHRVAAVVLGPGPHTWVAGIVGGLGPIQLGHAQHLNLVHHELAVLGGLGLAVGLLRRRPWLAGIGAAGLGLSFHLGLYMGVHAVLVGAVVAAVAGLARRGDRWGWAAAAAGFAGAMLTVLPVLWVYRRAALRFGAWFRDDQLGAESWDLAATLRPITGVAVHEPLLAVWPLLPGDTEKIWMDPINPGYVAVLLAGIGLVWGWRSGRIGGVTAWMLGGIAAVGAVFALGPELTFAETGLGVPGPYALVQLIPGFSGLRAPVRWVALVFMVAGVAAALGVQLLRARLGGWRGWIVVGVALVSLVVESAPQNVRTKQAVALHPAYAMLDGVERPGALYDEAAVRSTEATCKRRHALRAHLLHGRPLVGGHYARRFDAGDALDALAATWPSAEADAVFRSTWVTVTLEHPPYAGRVPEGWRCREASGHRLCALEGEGTGDGVSGYAAPWRPGEPRGIVRGELRRDP